MLTEVPWPMFVNYISTFSPWCHSVIVNDNSLLHVDHNVSKCSVDENTILSKILDVSVI